MIDPMPIIGNMIPTRDKAPSPPQPHPPTPTRERQDLQCAVAFMLEGQEHFFVGTIQKASRKTPRGYTRVKFANMASWLTVLVRYVFVVLNFLAGVVL